MKETARIKTLFEELYNRDPWLEITLVGTLKDITARQAVKKFSADVNSIWEITNHVISWRQNILQRVNDVEITTPDHNYFLPIKDTTEPAWQATLQRLKESETEWENFLDQLKDESLEDVYAPNGYSKYKHIHGIIQHDVYHLGQIVMLVKHFV